MHKRDKNDSLEVQEDKAAYRNFLKENKLDQDGFKFAKYLGLIRSYQNIVNSPKLAKDYNPGCDSLGEFFAKTTINPFHCEEETKVKKMNKQATDLLLKANQTVNKEYEILMQCFNQIGMCERQEKEQKLLWKSTQRFARHLTNLQEEVNIRGTAHTEEYHLSKIDMLTESKVQFFQCLQNLKNEKYDFDYGRNEQYKQPWRHIF